LLSSLNTSASTTDTKRDDAKLQSREAGGARSVHPETNPRDERASHAIAKEGRHPQAGTEAVATGARIRSPAASGVEDFQNRVPASPLVRKIAREKGISLTSIQGSGPHGRVIKRDLANLSAAALPQTLGDRPGPIITAASPMRKTIARRLVESKSTIP